jgi:Ca2+-binding RTX toxin-like protein
MAIFNFENARYGVNFSQFGLKPSGALGLTNRSAESFDLYGGGRSTNEDQMFATIYGGGLTYDANSFYKAPTAGTVTAMDIRFQDWVDRQVPTSTGFTTVRVLEETTVSVTGLDLQAASLFVSDASGSGWTGLLGLFGSEVLANLASGSDLIKAGAGADVIAASTGDDTVFGNGGNDTIDGGEGADVLNGGTGNDYILGGGGNDTISGGTDQDQLIGQGGDDMIFGDAGDDMLSGEEGHDGLNGGDGADLLFGGNGHDWLTGGAGADTLDGGAGYDVAVYSQATAAVVIDRVNTANSRGDAAGDSWIGIERFNLSAFNDRFVGNTESEGIYGGNGNDTIIAGAGDDWLFGEAGADRLDGGAGWDVVSYSTSTAAVTVDRVTAGNSRGDAAGDSYVGVERFVLSDFGDRFVGNSQSEFISGEIGHDTLVGNSGNDVLDGGAGNDLLTGGAGNDVFSFGFRSGQDVISDFRAGSGVGDVIQFSRVTGLDSFDDVLSATSQVGANAVVTLPVSLDGSSTVTLLNVQKSSLVIDDFAFI